MVLDSSNKGDECTSVHSFRKNVIESSPFPIHADLHLCGLQELAILRAGEMAPLIASANGGSGLSQGTFKYRQDKGQFQRLISLPFRYPLNFLKFLIALLISALT